ncbi:MAG: response regulator [Bacteroidia bacterium]
MAIEKLQKDHYDIILMDLQMPEMNGFEATEYIRNTMNSKIPIIALTADVTTVDLAKCKAVGMNDYLAKPVDERVLYAKIIGLLKNPVVKFNEEKGLANTPGKKAKSIDLDYLRHRTKSDPELMKEMISIYLDQTPPLVQTMTQSLKEKDWNLLQTSAHKLIPSFAIMGINRHYETLAKEIQESARTQVHTDRLQDLVLQIERICTRACQELETELNAIKN